MTTAYGERFCRVCSFERAEFWVDCRSLEEWVICHRCGYFYEYELIRDQNGEAVLDDQGHLQYSETETMAFGMAWMVDPETGEEMCEFIYHPITEHDIDMQRAKYRIADQDKSWFLKYDYSYRPVIPLIGNPPDFDQCHGPDHSFVPYQSPVQDEESMVWLNDEDEMLDDPLLF